MSIQREQDKAKRQAIILAGWYGSQKALADKVGVHQASVSTWISGRTNINSYNRKKLDELYQSDYGRTDETVVEEKVEEKVEESRSVVSEIVDLAISHPKECMLRIVGTTIVGVTFKQKEQ